MEIKIVEYDHSYAAKVADMWNDSASNWGNDDTITSKEDIINTESNSGNIKLYLALDGDKVVGYCSFSEYRMDEGTSYLPLLNVRPDYHGKKVGKKLILKVLEDAIKSKWDRFDLFTWSGNLKAVPLYKKCGFFWEKKNDSVHLMNFLPYVFKTEALKEYFDILDWYKDSKRKIELTPDGREENSFQYYEYIFERDGINLRLEFERKGRGLRLIETNDYLIKAYIDKQTLVFGYDYKIYYEIINKSGKELKINLSGLNDKNITFDFEKSVNIDDRLTIEGVFNVGRIEDPVNTWSTHPTVSTNISINGKKALFKIGVEPKAPVDISLNVPNINNRVGYEYKCYLDIENGFDKECSVSFKVPNSTTTNFLNESVELRLSPKQKISIPLDYILSDFGIYSEEVEYLIKVDNTKRIYKKNLSGLFRGSHGKYYGKVNQNYLISNGEYICYFDPVVKDVYIKKHSQSIEESCIIIPAKIGLPYSLEFDRINPHTVDYDIKNDTVSMTLNFNSRDFVGMKLSLVCKLSASGILEAYYILENMGDLRNNLKLSRGIFFFMNHTYMPYNNEILHIKDRDGGQMDYYDDTLLDENWLFRDTSTDTCGLCWDKDDIPKFNQWMISLEDEIGTLKKGGTFKTKSVYISLGHKNYKDFREFALAKYNIQDRKEVGLIDFKVNDDNPFFKDKYKITIKNNRKSSFEGVLKVNDETKEVNGDVSIELDYVDALVELDLKDRTIYKDVTLFKTDNNKVKTFKEKINDKVVYTVDNGLIKLKASPEFSDGLFSIEYDGVEWLESKFPTPAQKAWWNPWTGGINIRPSRLQDGVILQENISCEFVEINDNFGNLWAGIKSTLDIQKEEKYKGMNIENYYLLLPGTKVILTTSKITQNTGKYIDNLQFNKSFALNVSDDDSNVRIIVKRDDELTKYKCGDLNIDVNVKGLLTTESDRKSKLFICNSEDNDINAGYQNELNGAYIFKKISIPNGEFRYTANDFIIFSEDYLDKSKLRNLKNIKLK